MDKARASGHILVAALALTLMLWGAVAQSQTAAPPPAVLVADDIRITQDRRLVATGNVEALHGTTRLSAQAITYDPDTGRLNITGPITLDDGEGVKIIADQADLSADMQNGLLTGARLVLNNHLQLAAVQVNRVDGTHTQLYKTVVTSCRVCADDPRPPLWQIRARRVVHDEEGQQLFFDDAQLRVRGIPILYVPRLRLPDPTQDRASGFLFPEIRSDSQLGTGIRLPYFIKLGDHRDLTLTPYLSNNTRTLEFRYRQEFTRGSIVFEGAVTDDDLQPDEIRGYFFGAGRFDLNNGFRLQFDIETVSDDSYLADYAFISKDRLDSQIQISRARRDEFIRLTYINFNSLRADEDNDVLPSDLVEALYERRFFPTALGGEIRLSTLAHAHLRPSDVDTDANGDGVVDGRDVARFTVEGNWLRSFQLGGVRAQTQLGFAADAFEISDDATTPGSDAEFTPTTALTLRYPLAKQGRGGARHIVEPIAQIAWIGGDGLDVPNDESTRVEFDEGNLLSLSRFPAADRRDRGLSAAVGATWARFDPDGWSASLTMGQVFRQDAQPDFTVSSGLTGTESDFLLAGQLDFSGNLALSGRTLFDDNFDVTRAEVRGAWSNARLNVGGTYIWIDEDEAIQQFEPIGEVTLAGTYRIDRFWTTNVNMRYDIEVGRAATAAAGLTYQNECVRVGLTLNRSFADSTTIEPATTLGLTVSLRGFSANTGERVETRSCGKQGR